MQQTISQQDNFIKLVDNQMLHHFLAHIWYICTTQNSYWDNQIFPFSEFLTNVYFISFFLHLKLGVAKENIRQICPQLCVDYINGTWMRSDLCSYILTSLHVRFENAQRRKVKQCNQCDFASFNASDFKVHLKIHNEETYIKADPRPQTSFCFKKRCLKC